MLLPGWARAGEGIGFHSIPSDQVSVHRLWGWYLITFPGRSSTGAWGENGFSSGSSTNLNFIPYQGGEREDGFGERDEVLLLFQWFPSPDIPIFLRGWKCRRSPSFCKHVDSWREVLTAWLGLEQCKSSLVEKGLSLSISTGKNGWKSLPSLDPLFGIGRTTPGSLQGRIYVKH